jgi:hypothetical protein
VELASYSSFRGKLDLHSCALYHFIARGGQKAIAMILKATLKSYAAHLENTKCTAEALGSVKTRFSVKDSTRNGYIVNSAGSGRAR